MNTNIEIKKEKLLTLIEPHFHKDLNSNNYQIQTIQAKKLLSYARLDLAFKLIYIKYKNLEFTQKIYKEHINAFSLGSFKEYGNDKKNSFDDFIQSFNHTFLDIKKNGFDDSKTLIPLSKNGIILNGSHRVASAIFLNQNVRCVQLEVSADIYGYNFFYGRNVANDTLDFAVSEFIEYSDDTYIACIWPTAQGFDSEIEKIIPNIVYRKDIKLNANGAHNLLTQIYYGEKWLGNIENNFQGAKSKLIECFKTFSPVRIIAFQADNFEKVSQVKEQVRKLFNVGKHSIHITDTKGEALRISRMVFNKNSIYFLNYAKPNRYASTQKKITKFKKFIQENQLNSNDVLLDGGTVLSVYGLRKSNDIDYFIDDNAKIKYNYPELDNHDGELKYHDIDKLELIYNPKFYFYFNDLKFIAFNQLYKMKKNRLETKDINDCKIMDAIKDENNFKQNALRIKQNLVYFRVKYRKKIRFCYNSIFILIAICLVFYFYN